MAKWPYNTKQWLRLRAVHLDLFPLCEGCENMGRVVFANVVDHRIAISEGGAPFPTHDGLASLCVKCHSAKTVRGAESGAAQTAKPRKGCDESGKPFDKRHPWNEGAEKAATGLLARPQNLRASLSPLTLVFGPRGAGKSTYCQQNALDNDQVIDLDVMMADMAKCDIYQAPRDYFQPALKHRNKRLQQLANLRLDHMTWLILSGASSQERAWWRDKLKPTSQILIMPQRDLAIAQIKADERRGKSKPHHIRACYQWYKRYQMTIETPEESLRANQSGPSLPKRIELIENAPIAKTARSLWV